MVFRTGIALGQLPLPRSAHRDAGAVGTTLAPGYTVLASAIIRSATDLSLMTLVAGSTMDYWRLRGLLHRVAVVRVSGCKLGVVVFNGRQETRAWNA